MQAAVGRRDGDALEDQDAASVARRRTLDAGRVAWEQDDVVLEVVAAQQRDRRRSHRDLVVGVGVCGDAVEHAQDRTVAEAGVGVALHVAAGGAAEADGDERSAPASAIGACGSRRPSAPAGVGRATRTRALRRVRRSRRRSPARARRGTRAPSSRMTETRIDADQRAQPMSDPPCTRARGTPRRAAGDACSRRSRAAGSAWRRSPVRCSGRCRCTAQRSRRATASTRHRGDSDTTARARETARAAQRRGRAAPRRPRSSRR